MGYLGFFYVEAKSFEFRSDLRSMGGVRLVERRRGVFQAVVLGWPSVFWLLKVQEVLIKGNKLSEYWRTFRFGNTAYVLPRQGNKHGRIIELSEYGGGGRRSFVIILDSRDRRGWGDCFVQLQRLKLYYEKRREGVKKIGEKSRELPVAPRVVKGGQSYAVAVEVNRQGEERKSWSSGILGSFGIQVGTNMGNPHSPAK